MDLISLVLHYMYRIVFHLEEYNNLADQSSQVAEGFAASMSIAETLEKSLKSTTFSKLGDFFGKIAPFLGAFGAIANFIGTFGQSPEMQGIEQVMETYLPEYLFVYFVSVYFFIHSHTFVSINDITHLLMYISNYQLNRVFI